MCYSPLYIVLHSYRLNQTHFMSSVARTKKYCCGNDNSMNFVCTDATHFIVPVRHCTFIAALDKTKYLSLYVQPTYIIGCILLSQCTDSGLKCTNTTTYTSTMVNFHRCTPCTSIAFISMDPFSSSSSFTIYYSYGPSTSFYIVQGDLQVLSSSTISFNCP